MRLIELKVTNEDREKIKKRKDGDKEIKDGIFGHVELLRRLLEISPNCKTTSDLNQLLCISRKLQRIEDKENPVLEICETEWVWIKKILDHDKWPSFGPHFFRKFAEVIEVVDGAKMQETEPVINIDSKKRKLENEEKQIQMLGYSTLT